MGHNLIIYNQLLSTCANILTATFQKHLIGPDIVDDKLNNFEQLYQKNQNEMYSGHQFLRLFKAQQKFEPNPETMAIN